MQTKNEITGTVNLRAGIITIDDVETQSAKQGDAITRHYRTVIDTKQALIRAGLIQMGWTPPDDDAQPAIKVLLHSTRDDG